ncbi:EAL domain-containing protein [Moraxellaceae bacterium AER2_44_116]|nr:EAL domain-containing protein [Moraxellaceae bacterium]TQC99194.1 EAL domain-containing protein [Moraxellaceae bacterium AER2_44_116]
MRSLRSTIFFFFVGLLLIALCINFALVYRTTYQHTRQQVEQQLRSGWQVFSNELDARRKTQAAIASLITQDFGLRSEIANFSEQENVESLRVVLDNFRQRSAADLAMAVDGNGHLLAATDSHFTLSNHQLLPMMTSHNTTEHGDALLIENGHLYHFFVTPIYAPAPNLVGWFVLGYALNDTTARHLAELTDLEVSFVYRTTQQTTILASSLEAKNHALINTIDWTASANSTKLQAANDQLFYLNHLNSPIKGDLQVVLQRSLSEAMQGYQPLFWQLVVIAFITLILTIISAFFIASTVSKPLLALTQYVRKIGAGDYAATPPAHTQGEVEVLFSEFDTMRGAIAEREAQIAYAAYHDPLTELPNRLRFQQLLQEHINTHANHATAIIVLGLNHFKDINDTLGHLSGDLLLQQVAQRLAAMRREQDTIARFSGDAFVVLLTAIERHEVLALAMYYKQILDDAFVIENIAMSVNAAMGIALYPDHAEAASTLLQRAEIAMYVAKEKRLPCALYSQQQNRYSLLRLSLMSELRGAISRGELVLYYQPKLDIRADKITSVECLVRWQHPLHGLIFPDDFIPLAEQTGNIRFLTSWAIDTALAQCVRWQQQGIELEVAVNISSVDLQDPQFVHQIQQALNTHQLPAQCLSLEVTESAVMHDIEKAVELLTALRQLGIRLAMDDYGTGYSSMAQLKRLPIHEMKIDKSFVIDLHHNQDDAIIVRSTIELGHNMGLILIAEGVESEDILRILRQYGCDIAQGYGIGRPMPVDKFQQWWQQYHSRTNDQPIV